MWPTAHGVVKRRVLVWLLAASGILLLLFASTGIGLYEGWIRLTPRWAPWGAPDLRAEPGSFARLQLNSLTVDGNVCVQVLALAQIHHTRLADRHLGDACGYTDVVAAQPPIAFHPSLTATCGLTAALVWYEGALDRIARRVFKMALVRVDHVGTYVCRNINREPDGMRSEHATANAIDVTAFHLSDGRTISVARDWGKPTLAGAFLREAHAAACDTFNVVLGPDFNKAHATHFHLDLGRFRACR